MTKKTAYIQRQLDGHKNRISFINVYKLNKFNSTKMGVVSEIVQTFNKNFKGLAEIDFEYISEYFSLDYNNKKVKENEMLIKAELKSKNLCLVDGIGDNESQDLCSRIQNLLLAKYNISVPIVKDIMKDRLNWYLIHNKKYYLDGSDPYKDYDDRLYWWSENSDVAISDETKSWFDTLNKQYQELCKELEEKTDFLHWQKRLINFLGSNNRRFYFFEDLYFEFIGSFHEVSFRAWTVMLENLAEREHECRMFISVLANKELRNLVFSNK